jgi:hypothetical protein
VQVATPSGPSIWTVEPGPVDLATTCGDPVPSTVLMEPDSTCRTRWAPSSAIAIAPSR